MSVIGILEAELQSVTNGLGVAAQTAAAADALADNIGRNATASGFGGIMQALQRVRQLIQEARSELGAAASAASETRTAFATIPQQVSPEQAIAALTPLLERLTLVDSGIANSGERIGQARQAAVAALQGGHPDDMLARLATVLQTLAAVRQHTATARQHVQDAVASARQTGRSAGN